jgi:MinD-like ATPase involved in chromosome partitioning or flagellar assembly
MNEATRFVTFYSYKGGVGRTSALVNAAIHLALEGNNVLILDFDLEAPGTSAYLKKLDPQYDEARDGLLEYFAAAINGGRIPSLVDKAANLTSFLGGNNGGNLWVINAGNTVDRQYTARLETLKWTEIFENKFGELLLKNFRNQIIEEFARPDYIFIDSRTGITETGGVCTRYLADILVILTSLNEQNVNGTGMIYKELMKENKETILVAGNVPVGMPYGNDQLFTRRVDAFVEAFGRSPHLFIYYYPVLSLSEELPVLLSKAASRSEQRESLIRTDPLLQSYRRLAQIIDRPRKNQISYTASLKDAADELDEYFYTKEPPDKINILREYYSDRFLAKAMLEIVEMGKTFFEKPDSPRDWKETEYKRLIGLADRITNTSVKAGIKSLQRFVFRCLRGYLNSSGAMDRSLEVFAEAESLYHFVLLEEISKNRFAWPIDFLQRLLESSSTNDHFLMVSSLYNLSHCLLNTGDRLIATGHLKRFLEEFKKLDFGKYSAIQKTNFYFCAALANKELGLSEEAHNMRQKSEQALSILKPNAEVFSPLNYRLIPVALFRHQLETSIE